MIRPGFLTAEDRADMIALARDGSAAHRLGRRANALVLLDDGLSCEQVAKVLLVDDDTVRQWHRLHAADGFDALACFEAGGSACRLSETRQMELVAWIAAELPRSTRAIGAHILRHFGIAYESRCGVVALMHRLGCAWRKPETIPRKLDEAKQQAFIAGYQALLNSLGPGEAVMFADAVHPTHAARAAGCWAPSDCHPAIEQTSGRERLNLHGAIDLETGETRVIEAEAADAQSTIRLFQSILSSRPLMSLIHVFLDNARYHHAKLVRGWLAEHGRRLRIHFIPAYCPHLNPIKRLWGLAHRHVTHNKTYATAAQFAKAMLDFLRRRVPENWAEFRDTVTDNFRIISPKNFRLLA
jgi:transposase